MKTLAILSAVLAVTVASAAHAASKPKNHDAGGPMRQGQHCWVQTNEAGAGWWDNCDDRGRAISLHGLETPTVTFGDGGGGGGR